MFDRVISLIGKENYEKFKSVKVLIVGIGGVGGYAFETLVRTGILNIDIIDFDIIDETNLNRQIITNKNNIGLYKINEAKNHALNINSEINVNVFKEYLDSNNIENILSNNYDYIIDACDSVDTKVLLMKFKDIKKYKLISSMGTAKKIDATKLEITTLDKTNYDPLARVLRKKIKDLNIKSKMYVVSSTEKIIDTNNLGSMMMVPSTAGILCAQYVINDLINIDNKHILM